MSSSSQHRKHQSSSSSSKHRKAPKVQEEEEVASDEGLDLLDAYNLADTIQTDWENSAVPEWTPLPLRWLDRATVPTIAVDDEVASETESIEDLDTIIERTQALQEVDHEEQMGVAGRGTLGDEDQPDSSRDEDVEDFYMWPKFMDSIVYRLQTEIAISKYLMNKPERKVYFGHRRSDHLPVVVIVGQEHDPRLRQGDMPREVRLMLHLRGQKNVAEILGWTPVGQRHFVLVIRHYRSADVVEASHQNLFIISKVMQSAFEALKQVHDHKVVHRDIAKSNFLWNPLTDSIVLIDFDNACFFRKTGYYRDVGRDRYDAPEKTEMLELRRKLKDKLEDSHKKRLPASKIKKRMQAYRETADIYSLGVLMWMLLNGERHSPSPRKLKDWVAKVKQRNRHKKYAEIDLLVRLLNFDPERRITLTEALEHPFISKRPQQPDSSYANMKAYLFKKLDMEDECDTVIQALEQHESSPAREEKHRSADDERSAVSDARSSTASDDNEEDEEEEEEDEEPQHRSRPADDQNDNDNDELTPDEEDYDDHDAEEEKGVPQPLVGLPTPQPTALPKAAVTPSPVISVSATSPTPLPPPVEPTTVPARKPAFMFSVRT